MIRIGERKVGAGYPPFISAELGINHNGDVNLAFEMIDSAINCGVDAIKIQNYRTEDFATPDDLNYQMFKNCELTNSEVTAIRNYCHVKNIIFHSTPTSEQGATDLGVMGTDAFKIASDMIEKTDMFKEMTRWNKPIILSTGHINTPEELWEIIKPLKFRPLVILHCVSEYPATDPKLWKMTQLKELGYTVGYSDHTIGNDAAIRAAELGACFIEKHFTLDKTMEGPDHSFSADPAEMSALVGALR